ncbi:MAG: hypothetical protein QOJ73_1472 [Streptosporangiaceae bacterium]|nr:hypothetical protein [Streptosporangiaceae bacterium]
MGAQVGRSADYLSVAQFDLLSWVSGGCKGGTYEGTSYRVSARALHNRGLIRIEGRGPTWTAKITSEGRRLLKEQARRVEAERERERREEEARAEREREAQRLRARALEVLEAVTAAGGRLALKADYSEREVTQITDCLARGSLLPDGQRFAHEPTRMDPILGVTAYLEPDFAALTPMRAFKVPQQLRGPHAAVSAFQEKREHVSRAQIPRAARYLQGLVNAAAEMGWSAPAKVQVGYAGRSEQGPDLSIKLPSREILVAIRELDERGRPGHAFITQTDYLTDTERTTVNKSFTASGRLEVTLTRGWEQHPVLSQRDTGKSTLEDQLPALIRVLEIGQAEADWARNEEERRSEIREDRWKEVKKQAFVHVAYERNAKRLLTELDSRDAATAMCSYADEIDARASALEAPAARAAREWAEWIREHAERTDPLNGPLRLEEVSSSSHEELQPHMRGWSTHGPYRH